MFGLSQTPKYVPVSSNPSLLKEGVNHLMQFFNSKKPLVEGQKLADELDIVITHDKQTKKRHTKSKRNFEEIEKLRTKVVTKLGEIDSEKPDDGDIELKKSIDEKVSKIVDDELKEENSVHELIETPPLEVGERPLDVTASNMHTGIKGDNLLFPSDVQVSVIEPKKVSAVTVELERILYESEESQKEFDGLLPDIFGECNQQEIQELRRVTDALVAQRVMTNDFRVSCIAEVSKDIDMVMQHYVPPKKLSESEVALLVEGHTLTSNRLTRSWVSELNLPSPTTNPADPGLLDVTNQIFFKRVTASMAGLRANCLFSSPEWRQYKFAQYKSGSATSLVAFLSFPTPPPPSPVTDPSTLPPMPSPSPSPPPPPPPGDPEPFYYHVNIPPYRYVVGPILEFENNLEGRTFVYIKCYDDESYTTGFYFWVYLSQSEGLFRIFFKLQPNSIIEKGYDYTQATLVDFRLQRILCAYYKKHYNRGKNNPIFIGRTTARPNSIITDDDKNRFRYFFQEMSYLQSRFFLRQIPGGVIPCDYANPLAPDCSYVGITQLRGQNGPVPAYVGHYYVIRAEFNDIIRYGFSMRDNMFPPVPPVSNFHRNPHINMTSYPLIYCFTTCVMKVLSSSFSLFLDTDNHKHTFWCQGFENFTALMTPPGAPEVLSPVLYVITGSMLENPDFSLSKFRYEILNCAPLNKYSSLDERISLYNRSSLSLITLGTKDVSVESEPLIYLPTIDPYPRLSAMRAFKSFRDTSQAVYTEYQRRIFKTRADEMADQKSIVANKVDTVINDCRNILYSFTDFEKIMQQLFSNSFFDSTIRLMVLAMIDGENYDSHKTAIEDMIFNMVREFTDGNILNIRHLGGYNRSTMNTTIVQQIFDSILTGNPDGGALPDINDDAVFEDDRNLLSAVRSGLFTVNFPDQGINPVKFILDICYIRMNRKVLFKYTAQNNQKIRTLLDDTIMKCGDLSDETFIGNHEEQVSQKNAVILEFKEKFKELLRETFTKEIPAIYLTCSDETDILFSRVSHKSAERVARIAGTPGREHEVANAIVESNAYAEASGIFRSRVSTYYNIYDMSRQEYGTFREHLTDFAILCLKKNWLGGMMDNAYQALSSIFNDSNCMRAYYFAQDGNFIEIPKNQEGVFECLNPSNIPAGQQPPYDLVSIFNEKSVRNAQISVKVLTIAHIYRLDYEYEVSIQGLPRQRMSLFVQVSSTVVYSTQNFTILYACDMQRTPIGCIPDLPPPSPNSHIPTDYVGLFRSFLDSEYTICGTYRRVSSWGGFFSGKMMDYLFGKYFQAPSLFKLFINQLQVSPQYSTTALIYCNNIPPYSTLEVPENYTFLSCFMNYFSQNSIPIDRFWIQRCLIRHSTQIRELSRLITSHFMIDIDIADQESVQSYVTNSSSSLSESCVSSTTNSQSSRNFCSFDSNDNKSNNMALCYFLNSDPYEQSQCSNLDPTIMSQDLGESSDDDDDDDQSYQDSPHTPKDKLYRRGKRPGVGAVVRNMKSSSSSEEPRLPGFEAAPVSLQQQQPAFMAPSLEDMREQQPTTLAVNFSNQPIKRKPRTREPRTPRTPKTKNPQNKTPVQSKLRRVTNRIIHGGKVSHTYVTTIKNKGKGKKYKTFRKKCNVAPINKTSYKHPHKQTRRMRRGRK